MTHLIPTLSPDSQVILLLCGIFGKEGEGDVEPLSPAEYNHVAAWLDASKLRPADLLRGEEINHLRESIITGVDKDRLLRLLERGGALALSLESWINKGFWVLTRSDNQYPASFKTRLLNSAPPILYGVGNISMLSDGGLAIVGSRGADEQAIFFARRVAAACAREGIQVVSGGARGVDREAMQTALGNSGHVVGLLADSLDKQAVSGMYRDAINGKRLTLMSPFPPAARFQVGNAMSRNKCIFALSDWALVVSAAFQQGGTWAGAIENLKHNWVPLVVRDGEDVPDGNRQLLRMGGSPLRIQLIDQGIALRNWFGDLKARSLSLHETTADLFAIAKNPDTTLASPDFQKPKQVAIPSATLPAAATEANDPFDVIWPRLNEALREELTVKELAERFQVDMPQVKAWLELAIEEDKVKKLARPVRYVSVTAQVKLPFNN